MLNLISHAVQFDHVANSGNPAQVGHDEAANRIDLLCVIVDVEMLVQFMQQERAIHAQAPVRYELERSPFYVELVLDFTYDLFQQVFEGDDSGRASELVDDNRQSAFLCPKTTQHQIQRERFPAQP